MLPTGLRTMLGLEGDLTTTTVSWELFANSDINGDPLGDITRGFSASEATMEAAADWLSPEESRELKTILCL